MIKKATLIISLLIILFYSTNIFAESSTNFDIGSAQKLVLNNSKQLQIDDLDIKAKESALITAKKNAKDYLKIGTTISVLQSKISSISGLSNAETSLAVAKLNKNKDMNDIKANIYKTAQKVFLIQKEKTMENIKLSILQEKYNILKAKNKAGTIVGSDLFDLEYNIDAKKTTIVNVDFKLKAAMLDFNKLLGASLDQIMNISGELIYNKMVVTNFEYSLREAMKINIPVYQALNDKNVKQTELDLTMEHYKAGEEEYDTALVDLEISKLKYEEAKINFEIDIRNKYNQLLNQIDKVELVQKYNDLSTKRLKSVELKLQKKLVNRESYLGEQENNLDSNYNVVQEIYNYNILKADFDNLIAN